MDQVEDCKDVVIKGEFVCLCHGKSWNTSEDLNRHLALFYEHLFSISEMENKNLRLLVQQMSGNPQHYLQKIAMLESTTARTARKQHSLTRKLQKVDKNNRRLVKILRHYREKNRVLDGISSKLSEIWQLTGYGRLYHSSPPLVYTHVIYFVFLELF